MIILNLLIRLICVVIFICIIIKNIKITKCSIFGHPYIRFCVDCDNAFRSDKGNGICIRCKKKLHLPARFVEQNAGPQVGKLVLTEERINAFFGIVYILLVISYIMLLFN